jgi:aryl-alcohol dehydrogenase-like predicted oxidoreductase
VPSLGIGAWSWGDRSGYWGYGTEYGKEASLEAYKALIDAGLTFIDTAEVRQVLPWTR